MKEKEIVNFLREDMVSTLENVDLENIKDIKGIIEKQLSVIETLKDIKDAKGRLFETTNNESINEEKIEEVMDNLRAASDIKEIEQKKSYRFERKLRGGFVPDLEAFVPEGIVRKLGLNDGDMIFATRKVDEDPDTRHFNYELAEKTNIDEKSNRIQINYCPVKQAAGRLIVEESAETGEYIRFNEGLYTILLDERDVLDFNIVEGDLIDIAYPEDNIEKAKVIWKHRVQEETIIKPKEITKKSKKDNNEKQPDVLEQTLIDKCILVIGNEPKMSEYRTCIEGRGGTFLWGDASDSLHHLKAKVKKADIVVFLLGVSGHVGMKHIKRMCKEYDTEFIPTWSNGISSLVRIAEEA